MDFKTCSKCKSIKGRDDFYEYDIKRGGKRICKSCQIQRASRSRGFDGLGYALTSARIRSKKKGLEFDITVEQLEQLWIKQCGRCALSGIPFASNGPSPFVFSIDRINGDMGYIASNVRLILSALNTAINEHGLETYLYIAKAVISFSNKT